MQGLMDPTLTSMFSIMLIKVSDSNVLSNPQLGATEETWQHCYLTPLQGVTRSKT